MVFNFRIFSINMIIAQTPVQVERGKVTNAEAKAYSQKLPSVFYLDHTVTYRINHKKFSGIWAVQIRNLLNQHPDVGYSYNDFNQTLEPQKSMGILPVMSHKVKF